MELNGFWIFIPFSSFFFAKDTNQRRPSSTFRRCQLDSERREAYENETGRHHWQVGEYRKVNERCLTIQMGW